MMHHPLVYQNAFSETTALVNESNHRKSEYLACKLAQATRGLTDFPRIGRTVPEIGQDQIREVLVHGYRIIYRLLEDEVEVLTVHHGSRPLEGFEPLNEP
jgi:plasmid stabilization system protein ParE